MAQIPIRRLGLNHSQNRQSARTAPENLLNTIIETTKRGLLRLGSDWADAMTAIRLEMREFDDRDRTPQPHQGHTSRSNHHATVPCAHSHQTQQTKRFGGMSSKTDDHAGGS